MHIETIDQTARTRSKAPMNRNALPRPRNFARFEAAGNEQQGIEGATRADHSRVNGIMRQRSRRITHIDQALRPIPRSFWLGTALALLVSFPASGATNPLFKADLGVKEAFDSNVFLQDTSPGSPGALPSQKSSWVTTFSARVSLDYRPSDAFSVSSSYTPDVAIYHSAHSEDNVTHRVGLTFNGKSEDVFWEQSNTFVCIDGEDVGPLFARPQDVPAIGGIPLRDRRDALVYRGSLKLTWELGNFFLRPVGAAYVHDFRTEQRLAGPTPFIYVNFIDRQDISGGVDLGYKTSSRISFLAGYRYGRQDQYRGPSVFDPTVFADSPYDSAYHRLLVGLEGAPAPWMKFALLGGPDLRDWQHATPAAFERSEMLYWVDATITLLPTKTDTLVLLNRRYEQPAFTSQSVYEDVTYSISWKHKFDDHWTVGAGMQLYIGDWQAPINREDWIYTPSAFLTYTWKKTSVELMFAYDSVDSQVPNTGGREFTRLITGLGLRYSF